MSAGGAEFASTLTFGDERFTDRCRAVAPPPDLPNSERDLRGELRTVFRLWRAARAGEVLLVFSNRGTIKPELVATILFRLRRPSRRPKVVVYGDMWQPSHGVRGRLERAALRLADPVVARYVCDSQSVVRLLGTHWGVDSAKTRVVPVAFDTRSELPTPWLPADGYVFSGGDSGRDYGALLEVARARPARTFVVNTVRLRADDPALPPNVDVRHERHLGFSKLMQGASVVLLPLRTDVDRTIGTFTYLAAAALRRPIVVSSAPGVEEYLVPEDHAIVVDGRTSSYLAALDRVLDPANECEVRAMIDRAEAHVRHEYSIGRHVDQLLAVIDEVLAAGDPVDPGDDATGSAAPSGGGGPR